jgi:hypothetical protein
LAIVSLVIAPLIATNIEANAVTTGNGDTSAEVQDADGETTDEITVETDEDAGEENTAETVEDGEADDAETGDADAEATETTTD